MEKNNIPNSKAYNKEVQMAFALVFNYVLLNEVFWNKIDNVKGEGGDGKGQNIYFSTYSAVIKMVNFNRQ